MRKVVLTLHRLQVALFTPITSTTTTDTDDNDASSSSRVGPFFEQWVGDASSFEDMVQNWQDSYSLFPNDRFKPWGRNVLSLFGQFTKILKGSHKASAKRLNKRPTSSFVSISPQDVLWWLRFPVDLEWEGPKPQHRQWQYRKHHVSSQNFQKYVDLSTDDRNDVSIARYEKRASKHNLQPWSGMLVEQIVAKAKTIRDEESMRSNLGEELTSSHMAIARESVFADLNTTYEDGRLQFVSMQGASSRAHAVNDKLNQSTGARASSTLSPQGLLIGSNMGVQPFDMKPDPDNISKQGHTTSSNSTSNVHQQSTSFTSRFFQPSIRNRPPPEQVFRPLSLHEDGLEFVDDAGQPALTAARMANLEGYNPLIQSKSSVPCKRCRVRHATCDRSLPGCSGCVKAGQNCDYVNSRPMQKVRPPLTPVSDNSTNSATVVSKRACKNCTSKHRRCDKKLPQCWSCLAAGDACDFDDGRPSSRPNVVTGKRKFVEDWGQFEELD